MTNYGIITGHLSATVAFLYATFGFSINDPTLEYITQQQLVEAQAIKWMLVAIFLELGTIAGHITQIINNKEKS
jgi:hypothetical protein